MALVRRATIMGEVGRAVNGAVHTVSAVAAAVTPPAQSAPPAGEADTVPGIPHQPPAAVAASLTLNAPPREEATTILPTPAPPAWATNAEAAAVASKGANAASVGLAFLIVALGAAVGFVMQRWGTHADPFKIGNQTSAYAGLIVFAGAVERILEPFSNWFPGTHARNEYESSVAALANGHPAMTLKDVATAKAKMDRALADRAVLLWGVATALATVVSSASGFYLLHMIAAPDWVTSIPRWVDAVVTGLIVGTGTKPLHDLISRTQSGKASPAS
jgi:D-alanine-D-alanine ligase-like ATP-grasp enzyme